MNSARRTELLERTVDYAARHGIAELSLRPLADHLGTSSRMLIHYFGTKESLVAQALDVGRPDIPGVIAGHLQEEHAPAEAAVKLWDDLTRGGRQQPRLRLLLEVMALALTQPQAYGEYARRAVTSWVDPLADAFRQAGDPPPVDAARATLLVSGLRGLALDRYLTGERERTDAAAAILIDAATSPAGAA